MFLVYPGDIWRWLYNGRVCSDIVLFFVSPNIPRICVIHQDPSFWTVKLLLNLKACAHSGYYPSTETVVTNNFSHSLHALRFAWRCREHHYLFPCGSLVCSRWSWKCGNKTWPNFGLIIGDTRLDVYGTRVQAVDNYRAEWPWLIISMLYSP
jgi:hypothetical protein